jgi:hypothetical protein
MHSSDGGQDSGTPTSRALGTSRAAERFRWPVILVGAALIPVNSLWIARAEALDYSGFPTCMSLFYNVIFSLMALLLVNVALRRFLPRLVMGRQELLVVYAMMATGSSLVGHDCMQMLVPTIPHTAYFSTPANNWDSVIKPLLPSWLTITTLDDRVRAYELGHGMLYRWENLQLWIVPIACWSIFLLAVIGATLCMGILLRRQWVENERLSYPIVQIPLLITENGGANAIFRSKLFWGGFCLAAGIDLLNGMSMFFPSLPQIPVKVQDVLGPMTAGHPPWDAIGWTPISFYPFAIGLSFFMPTNLAFSSWFFFFARKAQQIFCAYYGLNLLGDPWFPYLREQSFGAWIAVFAATLWLSRGYLRDLWRAVLRGGDDGGVPYRSALLGFGACVVVMVVFLVIAGMTPWLAATYVVLYLAFCGALARVRAEAGPPAHEVGWVGVSNMLILAMGTGAVGSKNLAIFSLLYFQNRMHRGILMPQQVESLKAASQSGLRLRTMVGALALAGVVGVISAFWAMLHLSYGRSYATAVHPAAPGSAFAADTYNMLHTWLTNPLPPSRASLTAMLIGGIVTIVLAALTVRFQGFPFHPAGFALGMSFGLDYIWLPIMISWALKVMILRWKGLAGYRAAMPFFVGLVLGEFAMGGFWSFCRGVLGVQTYTFYIW